MEIRTFIPSYPDGSKNQGNQSTRQDPEGVRIRIRHDIMDAAEQQRPRGMTVKAYLNRKLAEVLLAEQQQ